LDTKSASKTNKKSKTDKSEDSNEVCDTNKDKEKVIYVPSMEGTRKTHFE